MQFGSGSVAMPLFGILLSVNLLNMKVNTEALTAGTLYSLPHRWFDVLV